MVFAYYTIGAFVMLMWVERSSFDLVLASTKKHTNEMFIYEPQFNIIVSAASTLLKHTFVDNSTL